MASGLTVNVNIEGITLPMTVKTTEDERIYREAASLVNARLNTMRSRYPNVPTEGHYAAMVMLNIAVELLKSENKQDNTPLMEMIKGLEEEISEVVK